MTVTRQMLEAAAYERAAKAARHQEHLDVDEQARALMRPPPTPASAPTTSPPPELAAPPRPAICAFCDTSFDRNDTDDGACPRCNAALY